MAAPSGSIVILTGPVGAGKTSIAHELLASSPGPAAYIEGDVFWSFIAKQPRRPLRGEQFKMIMRAMLASARHYARDGYETIVDFTIPPWYLEAVRALLTGKPFHYAIVRPSLAVCAARAAARSAGTISDYTEYRELYTDFNGFEAAMIADDTATPPEIADRVRAGIHAGTFLMR